MVRFCKTLFQVRYVEPLLVVQALILRRHSHVREGLLRLGEIILRREATTGAMLLPLMLDQAAAGHELQHVVHGSGRHRACTRAGHRRLPAAGLRPKSVQDETLVPADLALAGMVVGMARAVVGRPGKCQQVVIELVSACLRVIVVMVTFGKGGGSEEKKRAKESCRN